MVRLKIIFLFILLSALSTAQNNSLPSCEWCGADEAPANLTWQTTISSPDEPGEPLVINGLMYKSDKKTPAPDVILYMYHTNSNGIYPKRGDEKGNGKRHGYLRSWLRTDKEGRFRFTTIRPGSYPQSTAPAHIHMTVKEPDKDEYWINEIHFADDPFVTKENSRNADVLKLNRDEKGRWTGEHVIILKEEN